MLVPMLALGLLVGLELLAEFVRQVKLALEAVAELVRSLELEVRQLASVVLSRQKVVWISSNGFKVVEVLTFWFITTMKPPSWIL